MGTWKQRQASKKLKKKFQKRLATCFNKCYNEYNEREGARKRKLKEIARNACKALEEML